MNRRRAGRVRPLLAMPWGAKRAEGRACCEQNKRVVVARFQGHDIYAICGRAPGHDMPHVAFGALDEPRAVWETP